ncbi:MAG: GNAT family N-acetyltransferase [Candidatus Dormibacteraceae bacterium]
MTVLVRPERPPALEEGAQGPALTVSTIADEAGLAGLRADWDALAAQATAPSPFLGWDWCRLWWRHLGPGRGMRVGVVTHRGQVVGIAPLHVRRFGPVRMMLPFGWPDGLTEQMEVLCAPRHREQVLEALRSWLLRRRWTASLIPGLTPAEVRDGWPGQRLAGEVHFEHRALPATWDELVPTLNKSMRDNVKYYPRLMVRSGFGFELRVAESAAEVRAALPTLFRLHTARALSPVGEFHRDKLQEPRRRAFMEEMAAGLAARGEAKLGLLEVNGATIAAQMWLETGGTMFLYYSGYDPAWSKYSVAMVTTSEIMKHGMARGLRRVEFLRGTKQFKTRWDTEQRTQTDLLWVRSRWLLPCVSAARDARGRLRRLLWARRRAL